MRARAKGNDGGEKWSLQGEECLRIVPYGKVIMTCAAIVGPQSRLAKWVRSESTCECV